MDQILQTITDTIGGFFNNAIVQLALQFIAVYWVILWLAAAYWAFRDMQLRSDNPVLPYLSAALIVLFTPLLFPFGVIVYRIVRPQEKIGEVYERNLAEEALLAEVETIRTCPSCSRRIHEEWIICPTCRTRLNRVCANCGRLVGLDWSLCAWCGRDFERDGSRRLRADLDQPARTPRAHRGQAGAARRGSSRRAAPDPALDARTAERVGPDLGALTAPIDPPDGRGPSDPRDEAAAAEAPASDLPAAAAGQGDPRPPIATFSLEGRSVPALYLVGWAGSVLGLAVIAVSLLAGGGSAAPWLFLVGLVLLAIGLLAAGGSQAIERARRLDLAYRGPSPVLAFLAVIAITLVAIVAVLAPLAAAGLDTRSPAATAISLLITGLAYVIVIQLLVVGPGALTWSDMGLRVSPGAAVVDLATGAVLALPVLVLTLALGVLLGRFLQPEPSPLPASGDAPGLAANLLSAAILAPIGEELFFRGFATTAWARAVGAGPAIVRGAVFFAIAHVVTLFDASFATGAQRAMFSFVALLPVGVALGWLFLARRSLYASIGLHAAFNAIQVVLLFVAGSAIGG